MKRLMPILIPLMLSLNACAEMPVARLKMYVHDENGMPVEGATVQGYFTNLRYDYQPGPGRLGITNNEGVAQISGPALVSVNVEARKEGYYKSEQKIVVNKIRDQSISILLREKRDPIPMYAKKVVLKIPERGQEYGFDFLEGDLVFTGHRGKQSDLSIKVIRELIDENKHTQVASVIFNNSADGVIYMTLDDKWKVSDFKTNYMAPLEGYKNSFEVVSTRSEAEYTSKNKNVPFYVRLRTTVDSEGKVVSAHYCKIWPGMDVYGALIEKPVIGMTYYCNHTINDRNIEFDVNKNLFKNLTSEQRVSVP